LDSASISLISSEVEVLHAPGIRFGGSWGKYGDMSSWFGVTLSWFVWFPWQPVSWRSDDWLVLSAVSSSHFLCSCVSFDWEFTATASGNREIETHKYHLAIGYIIINIIRQ